MAIIKDISIPACICGVDKKQKIQRTAKQRVLTWMAVTAVTGIAILASTGGFSLREWEDPKGLIALGALVYCFVGVSIRLYKRLSKQKKHSFLCLLRHSFYDIV